MSIIDMHMHLKYRSRCSNLAAEDINEHLSQKIDGICLTDHWKLDPKKVNPFRECIKLFYGIEVSCAYGDILCYGARLLPSKRTNPSAEFLIRVTHSQGGVAVCAHPFTNRHQGFDHHVFEFEFDALEINGALDEEYHALAREAAEKIGIPVIGGSDAHSVKQMNTIATKFDNPVESIVDIAKAIKNNECRVIKI